LRDLDNAILETELLCADISPGSRKYFMTVRAGLNTMLLECWRSIASRWISILLSLKLIAAGRTSGSRAYHSRPSHPLDQMLVIDFPHKHNL
jgi:hypothetical protein